MSTPRHSYTVLYQLAGGELTLIEIRRDDLGEERDPSKLYHWLWFKPNGRLHERLRFVSMRSDTPNEERIFEQGALRYNANNGTFVESAIARAHALTVQSNTALSATHAASIDAYLDAGPG